MNHPEKDSTTLVVDLDGTLIRTDTLYESIALLLRNSPFLIFLLPFWLLRGKAHLKACLADRVSLDVSTIPVHEELLVWLRGQHMQGRTIMLCTGANYRVAKLFADSFGIFKEVIASSDTFNYSGIEKQKILEQRFGLRGFDYIGNSSADTHVWLSSRKGILVSNDWGLAVKASAVTEIEKVFPVAGKNTSAWLHAVRLHQWAKNLLLFVPLFAAHRITELGSLVALWTGFIAFGLCASGVYVFNDLIDLGNDRLHPRKKSRPFAYASLTVRDGLIIAPLLLIFGFGIATFVGSQFFGVLATYVLLTFLYTLWLKRLVLIDCIALAALYCLRILAGAVAVSVPPPATDNTSVRASEPVPMAPAASVICPFEACVVKLAGKLRDGVALTVAVPCALAGQDTLRVDRLTVVPSAPEIMPTLPISVSYFSILSNSRSTFV
ncbi:MAG: UbiA family prenyltransferase [Chitinophagia bacterium]|nr:UbiA family prenyltransferase [Chitinophagia bacterium]